MTPIDYAVGRHARGFLEPEHTRKESTITLLRNTIVAATGRQPKEFEGTINVQTRGTGELPTNLARFACGAFAHALARAGALLIAAAASGGGVAAAPAAVNTRRIIQADKEPGNWMSYGPHLRRAALQSRSKQINENNVSELGARVVPRPEHVSRRRRHAARRRRRACTRRPRGPSRTRSTRRPARSSGATTRRCRPNGTASRAATS